MAAKQRPATAGKKSHPAKPSTDVDAEQQDRWRRSAVELRRQLLKWYADHGRRLPWRESQDAYRIWLSEIMLQQTTVAAVIPYFQRFTERFPNVQALAAASIDEVLHLWEGLGYYSRARNLHRTAGQIVTIYNGSFPRDPAELQKLPGVGRYTAGAVASFAFGIPAPIVEANTQRLYARLMGLETNIRMTAAIRQLWAFAETIVCPDRPADFNQAVMDLGARVCRVADPECVRCPLVDHCWAHREQLQNEIPCRGPAQVITPLCELAVILQYRNKVLVRQRGSDERWTGMWDFPRLQLSAEVFADVPVGASCTQRGRTQSGSLFDSADEPLSDVLREQIVKACGVEPTTPLRSLRLSYSVTRYRIQLQAIACTPAERPLRKLPNGCQWQSLEQLERLPMPRTGRQITEWLANE
ncbi:MAG: A/G-specific adenine glycosylase [Planctomycetaceae bacterium]